MPPPLLEWITAGAVWTWQQDQLPITSLHVALELVTS